MIEQQQNQILVTAEDALEELGYVFGDQNKALSLVVANFLHLLIGPEELEGLSKDEVIVCWTIRARTNRLKAQDLVALQ